MEKNTDQNEKNKGKKIQDEAIKSLEETVAEKREQVLSPDDIAAISESIKSEASVEEQQSYARRKIRQRMKSKQKKHQAVREQALRTAINKPQDDSAKATIDDILALIVHSNLATQLFDNPHKQSVEIVMDPQIYDVVYFKQGHLVAFNPEMTIGEAIFGVVKALRQAWLSPDGDALYPLAYGPDDAILLNRILEADAITVAIWVAWELKLQGYDQAWKFALASNYAGMARSFQYRAKKDFRHLNNGLAAKAAFDTWFHSGLIKRHDNVLIQTMLSDEKGYFFDLDVVPMTITSDLVEAIATVPVLGDTTVNYLENAENKPLPETEYASVMDRSNANFLWFVKFERSFHETEKDLADREKSEKQRLDNIEQSRNLDVDVKERSKKDKKIVDFQPHFERQYNKGTKDMSQQKRVCGQGSRSQHTNSEQNKDNILYLFARRD